MAGHLRGISSNRKPGRASDQSRPGGGQISGQEIRQIFPDRRKIANLDTRSSPTSVPAQQGSAPGRAFPVLAGIFWQAIAGRPSLAGRVRTWPGRVAGSVTGRIQRHESAPHRGFA